MNPMILIRGGGDIATGIALRLFRSGYEVIMTELEKPLTVRRTVSFSEAIFSGMTSVEGIIARKVHSKNEIITSIQANEIPILVDDDLARLNSMELKFPVLVDARMEKKNREITGLDSVPLQIGIGPGFIAGSDCHIVIESCRGHFLGQIIRNGGALPDTGHPTGDPSRILRAPITGRIITMAHIGEILETGHLVATIAGISVIAPFKGLLRGLIHGDLEVYKGMKIGDMDHRMDLNLISHASDKAMAIAGSVLEVIMSDTNIPASRVHKFDKP
jgi:xanthine dehydrogenase accessory factor